MVGTGVLPAGRLASPQRENRKFAGLRGTPALFAVVAGTLMLGLAGCSGGPTSKPRANLAAPSDNWVVTSKSNTRHRVRRAARHRTRTASLGGGVRKIGKPYKIKGRWYYPRHNPNYRQVGMASWYGPGFHRKRTANGEIFDMNGLTAAHRTLPLPSLVKVTNLENGRSIVVRVNDRGPYANDRIIDLSKHAATALGMIRKGRVKVHVRYLRPAPLNGDNSYERQYLASRSWYGPRLASAASPRVRANTPSSWTSFVKSTRSSAKRRRGRAAKRFVVRAGTFRNPANAKRMSTSLSDVGPVTVASLERSGGRLYRVEVGPFHENATARRALSQVVSAGIHDAKMVSE